jgi:hypothetical protein
MKFASIVIAAALLTGCASTAICTQSNADGIHAENTRLLESKKTLEGYQDGKRMPEESSSRIQRGGLLGLREQSYNREVDLLVYRSKQFNSTCAKGKNGVL